MVRLVNLSVYYLVGCLGLILLEIPTLAHTVKVSGNIAATFHIEPDHNPKAGEPAKAWFALTQQGGASLPLAECDCKLAVYDQTDPTHKKPVQTPALQALSTEQYRDIPAATLLFSQAGNYTLVLSGTPKGKTEFQPFQLTYTVTVTAGMTDINPHDSMSHNSNSSTRAAWITPAIAGGTLLSLGILGFATRKLWNKRR